MWALGPRALVDRWQHVTDDFAVSNERSGAWAVDHALRVLAAGCVERQRPVPAAGAVVLGPDTVTLRLTTPDETPPPGWTVTDHGRSWQASLPWLATATADDRIPEPYPLLVSAGLVDDGRLLLNLAMAYGLISVEGDPEMVRSLIRTWSRRLTTSPWSGNTPVVRVGFPHDTDFTGWGVSRLVEAANVLDDPVGGIVLLAEPPAGRDVYQVERLLGDPARRWTVVVPGADNPTWRFTVRMDGTVDTGLLAAPVLLRP